jgi:hypothetical protein
MVLSIYCWLFVLHFPVHFDGSHFFTPRSLAITGSDRLMEVSGWDAEIGSVAFASPLSVVLGSWLSIVFWLAMVA